MTAAAPSSPAPPSSSGRPASAFERIVDSGRDGRFTVSPIDAGDYLARSDRAGLRRAAARRCGCRRQSRSSCRLSPAPVVEAVQIVSANPPGGTARNPQHQRGGAVATAHGRERIADGGGVVARSARRPVAPRLRDGRRRRRADPGDRLAPGAGADGRPAAAGRPRHQARRGQSRSPVGGSSRAGGSGQGRLVGAIRIGRDRRRDQSDQPRRDGAVRHERGAVGRKLRRSERICRRRLQA